LINLIGCLKDVVKEVIDDNNLDVNEINQMEEAIALRSIFDDAVKNLLEPEPFVEKLGEKLTF